MNNIVRNKWQVRVAAMIIFLLGIIAGGLALNAYQAWAHRARPGREDRFEQMATRLQLTAEQKTQVQQTFNETQDKLRELRKESEPRVNEIRQQTDQRLQQILNADQWQRFLQMRNEMRQRRRN
jgi:rubrerythrin